MQIELPALALLVLIGPSGSGKSTFAREHFRPTEVLSSDECRGLVADDENDQSATKEAFEVLHFIARKRLAAGRLTVIDATNVQAEARRPLLALAREFHVLPVAVVFDLPEKLCQERNRTRPDRDFGPHVIRRQAGDLRRSLRGLQREGFRYVTTFESPQQVAVATIVRRPLWPDRRSDHGPFDIIGDIHGCLEELRELLDGLGYGAVEVEGQTTLVHPAGRKAVFLGDLVDRGPDTPGVLRLVTGMLAAGSALCVPGNHDTRLVRKLRGRDVQLTHGLAETMAQLEREPATFVEQAAGLLDALVSHYVLDDGKLVVAHAGLKAELQGRASAKVRDFALYGETTGETDEWGLPVRADWAADYRGQATVVYGHTPVVEPEWLNNTINIDTGCVFGGRLTALRFPERELFSVPARRVYAEPVRPVGATPPLLSAQQAHDALLDIADVLGRRLVETRLRGKVKIAEANAQAALEVMSRFAVDPRWMIYLPPTMSPTETSALPGLLEHPAEAFAYFRHQGVAKVVCQQKHMGSRAVVVVCRDAEAARRRFGAGGAETGICYTRTGRRFFEDGGLQAALLERVRAAFERSGLWDELATDWACLDAELLPWSAKAGELLRTQYAPVGASARASLAVAMDVLAHTAGRGVDVGELSTWYGERAAMASAYVEAYRRYCWPVNGIADLRLAPFHLLATEGAVHVDKPHAWHLEQLARLAGAEQHEPPLLVATPSLVVDVTDAASEAAGVCWWEQLTASGGEGMVVKPELFVARGARGLVQPGIKCRGREYLRIIYGPEYTAPANLDRLRARGLSAKRSLALGEFALGVEALERFVRREPLRRVHECVFGVLALESEPVDPRL